jgi:hypothetical protein
MSNPLFLKLGACNGPDRSLHSVTFEGTRDELGAGKGDRRRESELHVDFTWLADATNCC